MNKNEERQYNKLIEENIVKLEYLSRSELNEIMNISTKLLINPVEDSLKNKCLDLLYKVCFLDIITLEECWQIYLILTMNLFVNINMKLTNGSLQELYRYIYKNIENVISFDNRYIKINERNKEKIVIVTSQFLGEYGHAPSKRVLDYSYYIQKYLGKKVTIINDSGMNYCENIYLLSNSFYYMDEYDNYNVYQYRGEKFDFYQIASKMPNISEIYKAVQLIYSINPLLVYNIGDSSIVSDLCRNFTTTVALACGSDLPISCSKYLLLARKVKQLERNRINQLESQQRIIETNLNYEILDSGDLYSRSKFNIPEEEFLICIIGNRLKNEIDEEILDLLNNILKDNTINVVFIGELENKVEDKILEKINYSCRDKLYFVGILDNASQLIKCTDLYLNPNRNGGGRSSCEALNYGVPVVTLKYGDVFYTVGEEFSVNTYEEMYKVILKYYQDKEFYLEMKEKAISRANELKDFVKTQKKIIDNIMKIEGEEYGK